MSWRAGLARYLTVAIVLTMVSAATIVAPPLASAATIDQVAPTSGSTDVVGSAAFTAALAADPSFTGVTFADATLGFAITSNGVLSTPGVLSVADSPYVVTGTDADGTSDTGTWSYSLAVTPDVIVQGVPMSGTTTTANSASFSDTLSAASGFVGPVTFTTTTSGFDVTGGDVLGTTAPLSASGSPYTVTGLDTDAYGDTGTWSYSLAVTSSGGGGGGGGGGTSTLVQTSATTGTVPTTSSETFTSGPITVENNTGTVTFITTVSNTSVKVSASGLITTTGTLPAGAYSVSGTDADARGDSGTWTYTLTVTEVLETVTFDANLGTGTMAPESASEPTALTRNHFTRSRHVFVDWNTSANGSGVSYANGAVFPFSASTTLYAQWKKKATPKHTITFAKNGGKGSMASETKSAPSAISANRFTRSGYQFVDWNTSAKGKGQQFKAGATFSFKKSLTLYAQWKKVAHAVARVVVFSANGGVGTMAPEHHRKALALSSNRFTRHGYTFIDWNTSRHGTGVSYANGATYPFATSTTLYAQWKKIKKKAPPPPPPPRSPGPAIGPFPSGSAALAPALEGQIANLASAVRSASDKQISLIGYGDKLTTAQASNSTLSSTNVQLGRERAQAVASYLQNLLTALGFKGWTISIGAAGNAKLHADSSDAGYVFATLS